MEEEIKKKKLFSRTLHRSKKGKILFFVISMFLLFAMYFVMGNKLKESREIKIKEDNFSWVCQVDSIEELDGTIVLSGFAFLTGIDAEEERFELILYDVETGQKYYPRMQYNNRKDVNDYLFCKYDYTKSGFIAKISSKKIDTEKVYEVLLRPIGIKEAYSIGVYYMDGEMFFVNPEEFVPLNTEGTDLEKITEQGVLRVYRPDYGMYVYQYEGELYWIAEEWYRFVENDTCIEFQMNTTQTDKLPKDRIENNWLWSNISFLFQSKELTDWNTGEYRVAKASLPTEYSITKIWTGNYIKEWIWRSDFRPWYVFNEE